MNYRSSKRNRYEVKSVTVTDDQDPPQSKVVYKIYDKETDTELALEYEVEADAEAECSSFNRGFNR